METINSAGAESIAFDTSGNLWLSPGPIGHTVVEYAKNELAKSGSPTPKVTITSTIFFPPNGVTFDNAGNLWLASQGASDPGTVAEFTKQKLDQSGPRHRKKWSVGQALGWTARSPSPSSREPELLGTEHGSIGQTPASRTSVVSEGGGFGTKLHGTSVERTCGYQRSEPPSSPLPYTQEPHIRPVPVGSKAGSPRHRVRSQNSSVTGHTG